MVFSSYRFLFAFLPIVLLGYYLLSSARTNTAQRIYLLLASFVFYGFSNPKYLFLLFASIVINYLCASGIQSLPQNHQPFRKLLLITGLLFNILLIGYYKYYDYFVLNINRAIGTHLSKKSIILPLGISFFTFQQLSLLVSVYKQEESVDSFLDYSLFITFFPQLVAGPIVLYNEMVPQIRQQSTRRFNIDHFIAGIYIFSIGIFKKVVIADTFSIFATDGFALTEFSLASTWAASLCYTMQIYFDFSGYSDMATGLARMFNIYLPVNFRCPYQSSSISEFWRRWHITLGRVLSRHVYIPLGGNRQGQGRTCLNLLLTFIVSGFWHGAGNKFILWGLFHGLFIIAERLSEKVFYRIPKLMRTIYTFLTVNFLWVMFRAPSVKLAFSFYRAMFDFSHIGLDKLSWMARHSSFSFWNPLDYICICGSILLCILFVFKFDRGPAAFESFKPTCRNLLLSILLFCISLTFLAEEQIFIYFNF